MISWLRTDIPTHDRPSVQVGSTPLHETAFNDFEDAAEMLLKAGCKADEINMVSVSFAVLVLNQRVRDQRCCILKARPVLWSRADAPHCTWHASKAR